MSSEVTQGSSLGNSDMEGMPSKAASLIIVPPPLITPAAVEMRSRPSTTPWYTSPLGSSIPPSLLKITPSSPVSLNNLSISFLNIPSSSR